MFELTPSGREVTIDVVEAGHIIGESAFVPNRTRSTCIQAVNAVLLSCRAQELLLRLSAEPELGVHFLQQCSDTMDRLAQRLHQQCLLDRYGKVASLILDLTVTDSPEKGTMGGNLSYAHAHIADSLGLNRSAVSGALGRFETEGWIENGYRHLRVKNRQALEEFVRGQLSK